MLDIGDVYPATVEVRDATGELVAATSVTFAFTLPDGTTESVTPASQSTGRYAHDFLITQHGLHRFRAESTGPNTAFVDVFNAVSADWPAFVGLAEVKAHLNIPADDTTDDEELRGFILSASEVVEDIVGVVARRTVVETASGGGRNIVLERSPVESVTSISVDGAPVDPGEYAASPSGLVTSRYGFWPAGLRNIEITYVAGRPQSQWSVVDATKELIRINWRPQQGGNYSAFDGGSADDFGAGNAEASLQGNLRLGFFVPNTVIQRLAPHQRGPVVL